VAVEAVTSHVAYYTISAASIPLVDLPPGRNQAFAALSYRARCSHRAACRGPEIFQGRGLGGALLADAASRTLRADAAAFTLLVDAKNDQADAFYQRFGFRVPVSRPRTLFLPLATAQKVLLQKNAVLT